MLLTDAIRENSPFCLHSVISNPLNIAPSPFLSFPPQACLLQQARQFRDSNIVDVKSYDELKEAVAAGEEPLCPPCMAWREREPVCMLVFFMTAVRMTRDWL